MREIISIISFLMAVTGALATVLLEEKDKQTMASVVGVVFLISFFINAGSGEGVFLQIACAAFFGLSVLSGVVAIFGKGESKRTSAVITGIVCLGTSLLILFLYLAPPV